MSDGIIPEDAVTESEELEELTGYVHYYDDVIDMLRERLEELGEDNCICTECLNKWREDKGETLQ